MAPAWALVGSARFAAWMHAEPECPFRVSTSWPPYPESFGSAGGQRMSGREWNGFKGVCGHTHAPENDHGDPGAIDFNGLMKLAKAAVAG